MKFGGEVEWRFCWETYKKTQIPSEKRLMLQALGSTTDPWLLQRYLLQTLDRETIKAQDVESVMSSVASNSEGKFLAWRHMKAYWSQLHQVFGDGSLSIGGLISVVISDFFTEYDYQEVSTVYMRNNVPTRKIKLITILFIYICTGQRIFQKRRCRQWPTSLGSKPGDDKIQHTLGRGERRNSRSMARWLSEGSRELSSKFRLISDEL